MCRLISTSSAARRELGLVAQACKLCGRLRQEVDKLKASLGNPVRACLTNEKLGAMRRLSG